MAKYDDSNTVFFVQSTRSNGLVVKVSCRESGCTGLSSDECWNSLHPLGHFAWHWARQCTDTRAFYIAVLSIICQYFSWISSVAISRWQSTQPLGLFFQVQCFGELELGPGPALTHKCWPCTWAEIIAVVEPQSWLTARSVALFIPDFSKIQKKRRPHKRLL